jgi:hypothetical protein
VALLVAVVLLGWASGVRAVESAQGLRVVSVAPRGELRSRGQAKEIRVVFDRPMVPLRALGAAEETVQLRITPPIPGTYRWASSTLLLFTPSSRLPLATRFTVTIPAGVRAMDGAELAEDYRWSFTTMRPWVERASIDEGAEQVPLEPELVVVFNQAVDLDRAAQYVSLVELGTGREAAIELLRPDAERWRESWGDRDIREGLRIRPLNPLSPGRRYQLVLASGLPGVEGPFGMAGAWRRTFATYQRFEFLGQTAPLPVTPGGRLTFLFTNQVRYKDLFAHLRIDPPVEIPKYYLEREYAPYTSGKGCRMHVCLDLRPRTRYTFRIDGGLPDVFGNLLGRAQEVVVETGDYEPWIDVPTGFGVVEADGDRRHPLEYLNLESVGLRLADVPPGRAVEVLEQRNVFSSRSHVDLPGLGIPWVVDRQWRLKARPNQRMLVPIELGEALPPGRRHGLVFFELATPRLSWPKYSKGFLQVTEMSVTAKFSPDRTLIWVTRLADAGPVSGADVEIRDADNTLRWAGVTDGDGFAEAPGWKVLGLESENVWSKPTQYVIVRKGSDAALLCSDMGTGISPWRFGINYEWRAEPDRVAGTIFSDRGVYRPGETVHLKGVLRELAGSDWSVPTDGRVKLVIRDPEGETVVEEERDLNRFGAFARDFEIGAASKHGYYSVRALLLAPPPPGADEGAPRESLGEIQGSFRVTEFRPAEFEVEVGLESEHYLVGEELSGLIEAHYLFGAPMAGRPVKYSLLWSPQRYTPPGHDGFRFEPFDGDEDGDEWRGSKMLLQEKGELDEQGALRVAKALALDNPAGGVVTLEAEVEGLNRRSISGRAAAYLHPAGHYVGVRPTRIIGVEGEELPIEVLACDYEGRLMPGVSISVRVMRRQWHSIRKAGVDGRYSWVTEMKDEEKLALQVTSGKEPVTIRFTPDAAGFYVILTESTDAAGRTVKSGAAVYVAGSSYAAWAREDDDRIELVPDAEEYAPGDVATVLVQSPYERCRAIVSLERETVLEQWTMELTGTSETLRIPIKEEYLPNVYLSVILLQGRTARGRFSREGDDLGKPSFKIGYVNLPVTPESWRLQVEVLSDAEEYRPGGRVSVELRVRSAAGEPLSGAEITLAVVDAGVLNLIGYETPDLFPIFYGQRPLAVETAELRQHVIGERNYGEKGEDRGGGGAAGAMPGMRRRFESCAYWNPSLITDETGVARVSFPLPDNLTSFRIMAVAQSADSRFGSGDRRIRVNKPLMLRPVLPRFTLVGDQFRGGVVVHNNMKRKARARITLDVSGVRLLDDPSARVVLRPGESRRVSFSFRAERPGEAVFRFTARARREEDGVEARLPVQLPRASEWVSSSGSGIDDMREWIEVPEEVIADSAQLDVAVSSTALVGLRSVADYLFDYPYGCLEQHLSRILPMILFGEVVDAFELKALEGKDYHEVVQEFLDELSAWETPRGGFSYWRGGELDSPYVSGLAFFAMLEARDRGYRIDEELLQRSRRYLVLVLHGETSRKGYPYSPRCWAAIDASIVALLARAGDAEPAYVERLFRMRRELPLSALADLYKAVGRDGDPFMRDELRRLLDAALRVDADKAYFEEPDGSGLGWIFFSRTQVTAAVLQALLEVDGEYPHAEKVVRYLLGVRKQGRYRNTFESYSAFQALGRYFRIYEGVEPDFEARVELAQRTLLSHLFQGRTLETAAARVSLAEEPRGTPLPIDIRVDGQGRCYYELRMEYAPRGELPPREAGFTVTRRFETLEGVPVDPGALRAGEVYVVHLEVFTLQDRLYVVLDDPLPAGLEAVQSDFLTESRERARALRELSAGDARGPWWAGFDRVELHDDRVLHTADYLPAGSYDVRYLVRASTPGEFQAPPPVVLEMYSPEIFGRGESGTCVVR